jgi:hypothetical protein
MVSVTQADDPIPRRDSPRTDLDPGVVPLDWPVAGSGIRVDIQGSAAVPFRGGSLVALGDIPIDPLILGGALPLARLTDGGWTEGNHIGSRK